MLFEDAMFLTTNSIGYVEAGGIVYLVGGSEAFASAVDEAKAWKTFLSHFTLSVALLYSWLSRRFNPRQAEKFFKSGCMKRIAFLIVHGLPNSFSAARNSEYSGFPFLILLPTSLSSVGNND